MANRLAEGFAAAAVPGCFWVDFIPWCMLFISRQLLLAFVKVSVFHAVRYIPEWFPGATFQRKGRYWRENAANVRDIPFEEVKSKMVNDIYHSITAPV